MGAPYRVRLLETLMHVLILLGLVQGGFRFFPKVKMVMKGKHSASIMQLKIMPLKTLRKETARNPAESAKNLGISVCKARGRILSGIDDNVPFTTINLF